MEGFPFDLKIISSTGSMYEGKVKSVRVTGCEGELGIRYGHTPLLTVIKSGMVAFTDDKDALDELYLAGGVLEVQPDNVTILADTALRGAEIDESKAQEAMRQAREAVEKHATGDVDYNNALAKLADAMAQLKVVQLTRNRRK